MEQEKFEKSRLPFEKSNQNQNKNHLRSGKKILADPKPLPRLQAPAPDSLPPAAVGRDRFEDTLERMRLSGILIFHISSRNFIEIRLSTIK